MTKLHLKPIKTKVYEAAEEKEFKRSNMFGHRPKGIVIFDSYNNPFIPLKNIDLDDAKFSYMYAKQELKQNHYTGFFTPWHYWIEFINNEYVVIEGRPINYKSMLTGFEEHISICIAGNSKNDIYMKNLYKTIADVCLNSLRYMPAWKINIIDETTLINMGPAFLEEQLIKYIK